MFQHAICVGCNNHEHCNVFCCFPRKPKTNSQTNALRVQKNSFSIIIKYCNVFFVSGISPEKRRRIWDSQTPYEHKTDLSIIINNIATFFLFREFPQKPKTNLGIANTLRIRIANTRGERPMLTVIQGSTHHFF